MYLSVITATNKHLGPIGALTYKMAAKINMEQYYVTVTLCIGHFVALFLFFVFVFRSTYKSC